LEKADLIVYILGTSTEITLINNQQFIGQNDNDFFFSKIQYDLTEKRVNLLFEYVHKQQATVGTKDSSSSSSSSLKTILSLPREKINKVTKLTCDNSVAYSSSIESGLNLNEATSPFNKRGNQSDDDRQIDLYRLPSQMLKFVKKISMSSHVTNTDISVCEIPGEFYKKIVHMLTIKEMADWLKELYKLEVENNQSLFVFEIERKNQTTTQDLSNYEDLA
jgi:hypothetical protein